MTCKKCGRENPEGQRFCGFCGASIEVETIALSPEKRKMVVDRLHQVHSICVQAYGRIQKGQELCSRAEYLREKYKGWFFKAFSWIFGTLLLISLLYLFFSFKAFAAVFGIFSLYAAIPLILFFILFILLPRRKGKVLQKEGEEIHQAGVNILSDNAELLAILPFEYCYPMATEYITRLFETNRVDTMREALKMFDEQKHRWTMEEGQQQILKNQQMQYETLCSVQDDVARIRSDVNLLAWDRILDF